MAKKLVVAKQSFACEQDGKEVLVHVGTVVPAGDKLVKGREALFEPYDPAKPEVE